MEYIALLAFVAALVGVFKPYVANVKRWHFGVAAFVSFLAVGIFAPAQKSSDQQSTSNQSKGDDSDSSKNTEAAVGKWTYSEQKDEMRGSVTKFAELGSENTINLDFPYGKQRGLIQIRRSNHYGLDVIVGVKSGQILCNSFQNTRVSVKFDGGAVQKFGCTDASDGTNNMVFILDSKRFLANLKKSNKVIIEAEFFQNGNQQMTFDSKNLIWE